MSTSDKAGESPVTVSMADEDAVRRIVSGAIFDLWRIVNDLTKLRPSARERYRVAIFGSARAQEKSASSSSSLRMIPLWIPTTGPCRTGWLFAVIEGWPFV